MFIQTNLKHVDVDAISLHNVASSPRRTPPYPLYHKQLPSKLSMKGELLNLNLYLEKHFNHQLTLAF